MRRFAIRIRETGRVEPQPEVDERYRRSCFEHGFFPDWRTAGNLHMTLAGFKLAAGDESAANDPAVRSNYSRDKGAV